MSQVRATLVTDGSSDAVLVPLLAWLWRMHSDRAVDVTWADLRHVRTSPRSLTERVRLALDLYPCDILFVHRDSERQSRSRRVTEIRRATSGIPDPPVVCVVPVRMQEAWLLIDEVALRAAAGNPAGRTTLDLPALERLEQMPDPKRCLHETLAKASGLTGRRLKAFSPRSAAHRLGQLIEDFSALRSLAAFQVLETELVEKLTEKGWNRN